MPWSSALFKLFIPFNVVSNSSNVNFGINLIIILSRSFGSNGFGDENREPRNIPNSYLSIGHAEDWIGAFIIFCTWFVFSNFVNRYSAHFDFHCRNSFLACQWICLLRTFRLLTSFVSFLCRIKSFSASDWNERFMPLVPWRWIPPCGAAFSAIFPKSWRDGGGHSSINRCRWAWYRWGSWDASRIGFHPLNDFFRIFQCSGERQYSIEAETLRWSDPKSNSWLAEILKDRNLLECKI